MFVNIDNYIINVDQIVFITPVNVNYFRIELRDKHFVNIKRDNEVELTNMRNQFINEIRGLG